jgi:O-antigen ligase
LRVAVLSLGLLAAATAAQIWQDWAAHGYGRWLFDRYVGDLRASRFSPHLKDLNAAGSLYTLAALGAATLALHDRRRRWLWGPLTLAMLPAFWVTGSRTALVSALLAAALVGMAWRARRRRPSRVQLAMGALAVALVAAATVTLVAARGGDDIGSASRALGMRWQFLQTSAGMFASAPVYGVGIGRYHGRSAEFMPPELHAIYPNENAHNYFAQQFAELGVVGGALFLWLVVATLAHAWRRIRADPPGDGSALALLAGCAGYVVTCVSGHPLLVSEAALPFWALFGALGALGAPETATRPRGMVWSAPVVAVLIVGGLAASVIAYRAVDERPAPSGFHEASTAADGTAFTWITRHAVIYGGRTPGFVRLVLRAPDVAARRPYVVETWVGGRVVDRTEVPRDRWVVREVPVGGVADTPFRRIDVHVNQSWVGPTENRNAPDPPALGVMAAEIRWAGPGSR